MTIVLLSVKFNKLQLGKKNSECFFFHGLLVHTTNIETHLRECTSIELS